MISSGIITTTIIGSIQVNNSVDLHIKMHGASGMLDPEHVIFYHPCNDFVEHTLTDTWLGTAEFVSGVVDNGFSAIPATGLSWGSPTVFESGGTPIHFTVNHLDTGTNRILATYSIGSSGYARIGVVSGENITWGDSTIWVEPNNQLLTKVKSCSINPSSIVINFRDNNGGFPRQYLMTGHVSGTTITLGNHVLEPGTAHFMNLKRLNSTQFVVGYAGRTSFLPYAKIGTPTGASGLQFSIGASYVWSNGASADSASFASIILDVLDSTHVVGFARYDPGIDASGLKYRVRIGEVSGTTINWGSGHQVVPGPGSVRGALAILDSSRLVVSLQHQPIGVDFDRASVGVVSGVTVTFGPDELIRNSTVLGDRKLIKLSDDKVVAFENVISQIGTVSGNSTSWAPVSVGGNYGEFAAMRYEDDKLLVIAKLDDNNNYGAYLWLSMDRFMQMQSLNDEYPKPIGVNHLSVCMWCKNPSKNLSTTMVERGYQILITSGTISLGGTTATWNSAGIQSMLDFINDGDEHFLVLDFTNTSGTNWSLKTSVGGSAFVDRGVQDVGSQSLLVNSSDAEILLYDPQNEDQWVDEVVMWGGDINSFDEFTSAELQKLRSLGALLSLPMDKFDETTFVVSGNAPVNVEGHDTINENATLHVYGRDVIASSAKLHMRGHVAVQNTETLHMNVRDTISTDITMQIFGAKTIDGDDDLAPESLFMWGHEKMDSGVGVGLLIIGTPVPEDQILNRLLKTADHNPQAIGTFGVGTTSVTIEIWDLIGGSNVLLVLADNTCYPIGDTGRWGWSTANLPADKANVGQYLFRMTSNVSTKFEGEFFLNSPEEGRWKMPRNPGDYLV